MKDLIEKKLKHLKINTRTPLWVRNLVNENQSPFSKGQLSLSSLLSNDHGNNTLDYKKELIAFFSPSTEQIHI